MTTSSWILLSVITLVMCILIAKKIRKLQKQNKVIPLIGILWILFSIGFGFVLGVTITKAIINSFETSEIICKEYVIEHSDEITFGNYDNSYKIDTCLLLYWDDITIRDYQDSIYILFWGDRDSWKWKFNDKGFWIYRSIIDIEKYPKINIESIIIKKSTLDNIDTLDIVIFDIIRTFNNERNKLKTKIN